MTAVVSCRSPDVAQLRLYDVANTAGVAADLSHINTAAAVTGHTGPEQLQGALEGCDLVVIPAGVPRKPGMTRDDLFNINAGRDAYQLGWCVMCVAVQPLLLWVTGVGINEDCQTCGSRLQVCFAMSCLVAYL